MSNLLPAEPSDLARWRDDTEGCTTVAHFNNAGSSLSPRPVLDAVIDHLRLEATIGGYEAAAQANDLLVDAPMAIAELVGSSSSEIAQIENATRAWDMAFYSIPFAEGDIIITGVAEYVSNYLAFLQVKEQHGVNIEVCPDDRHGQIDLEELDRLCAAGARLIAVTHTPTNGGLINPAEEIGKIAKKHGVLYLLDACQTVGQIPVNVEEIGCDFLSVTGRKFLRGLRGTGFLYANASTTADFHPPFIDLQAAGWVTTNGYELSSDATRFETWENYVAGRIGLGVAVRYALAIGLDVIEQRNLLLAGSLREQLAEIPGITIEDKGQRQSAIVTFAHGVGDRAGRAVSSDQIKEALGAKAINVSVSRLSSTRLDFEGREIDDVVRASVHYFNSEEEVDRLVEAVTELVGT